MFLSKLIAFDALPSTWDWMQRLWSSHDLPENSEIPFTSLYTCISLQLTSLKEGPEVCTSSVTGPQVPKTGRANSMPSLMAKTKVGALGGPINEKSPSRLTDLLTTTAT